MTTQQQIEILKSLANEMNGYAKRDMENLRLFRSMRKKLECNCYHCGKHGDKFIWVFTLENNRNMRLVFDLEFVNRFEGFVKNGRLEWE